MWINQLNYANLSFLVVDDAPSMRGVLRDMLRQNNAQVVELRTNGDEAIEALRLRAFDVVLCDDDLGDGRNGQQVLEEAKARGLVGPACAWLMLCSEKSAEMIAGVMEYQPDGYLLKPFKVSDLQARLQKIMPKKIALVDIDQALRAKDYRQALTLCDGRLAAAKTPNLELLRIKCNIHIAMDEPSHAKLVYEQIIGRSKAPWAKVGLAKLLYREGDYAAAKAVLQTCMSDSPSFVEAYDWMAKVLLKEQRMEEAEEILARAVKLSPNSPTRQAMLGEVAMKGGHTELAEKAFRKSVNVGKYSISRTADAYLGLARSASANGRLGDALQALTDVGREFDEPAVQLKAQVAKGIAYQENGQADKALDVARTLATLVEEGTLSTDAATTADLADLLITSGGKTERTLALQVVEGLVRDNHDNQAMVGRLQAVMEARDLGDVGRSLIEKTRQEAIDLMSRGALLAREGRYSEAVDWMRQAKAALPGNARVLFNAVAVMLAYLEKLGHDDAVLEEARVTLASAVHLAPDDERAASLAERLHHLMSSV